MTLSNCYSIELTRFVVILGNKSSCLSLFDVRVYSGQPITSTYPVLRSFEPYEILVSICSDFERPAENLFSMYIENLKKVSQQKYWLDETSIRQIRCLDKLDEGIFQAEICLLEIRQQLMLKSTFLLSHRNSDFHEFVKYRSSHLARLRHTFVNITPS